MIFQGGKTAARLPQLHIQCFGGRRATLNISNIERVAALYNASRSNGVAALLTNPSLIAPIAVRTYTDRPVSRPKAHTGRTTAAARKAPTTSKTKAAKEPATRTKTAKAKPASKSKVKPKRKPKPKPAKKVRKPKALTEEQKKEKRIKDLKVKALSAPHGLPATAWVVFAAEKTREKRNESLAQSVKAASAQYKALTPEQLEHYNHLANQNRAANQKAYRQWIESHTPATIHEANNARMNLRRRGIKGKFSHRLQDTRQVKGTVHAYSYFLQERYNTGDFKGLKVSEAARLASREYKALSASERKPYEDKAKLDMARYVQETKTVLGRDVKFPKAAAAA